MNQGQKGIFGSTSSDEKGDEMMKTRKVTLSGATFTLGNKYTDEMLDVEGIATAIWRILGMVEEWRRQSLVRTNNRRSGS